MLTMRGWLGIGGLLALTAMVGLLFWQANAIGTLKADLKLAEVSVASKTKALEEAAVNLRNYQNGNVFTREQVADQCRTDAAAAYDAGRLFGERNLRDRQSAGAFVPRQRQAEGRK